MGVDLLDFTLRVEKRLQIRLEPRDLLVDRHTTVSEVVELLWQRLHGLAIEKDSRILSVYAELHTRIMPIGERTLRGWRRGVPREDRRLDDLIPPDQRAQFWSDVSRDLSYPLPPLSSRGEARPPHFPEEIPTQRRLLHLLRAHLFQGLKWIPIGETSQLEVSPIRSTVVKMLEWSLLGRAWNSEGDRPHRSTPWIREELLEIVTYELVETLRLDPDEVAPNAELFYDLEME